jgi:excisionase family DNA binding protein
VVERLIPLREAAATLSMSTDYLKRLHRAGRIRVVRLGRSVRISETELQRLVREGVPRARAR